MRMKRVPVCLLIALALCLAIGSSSAQATRTLLTEQALETSTDPKKPLPPPDGQIEGACGLTISGEALYVSDYYHGLIYAFSLPVFPLQGTFKSATSTGISPEGPCQLTAGPEGALYANLWHQSVVRVKPTPQTFDIESSTGVAVDSEGKVYVNDRTHVNVYSAAGALLSEVGVGNLKDAYGLAIFGKKLYVPDAGTNTIKVFEPALDPLNPKQTITGAKTPQKHFVSLVDASIAIDPTNGNVLVLDNLQPGYEFPKGAIDEFDSSGAFLSQLKETVIDGGPSGMAVDPGSGVLFVTSGNSEGANVFAWSAYGEGGGGAVGPGEPESEAPATREEAHPEARSEGSAAVSQAEAASSAKSVKRKRHRRLNRQKKRRAVPPLNRAKGAALGGQGKR